jgi:uncharacterized protein HemY
LDLLRQCWERQPLKRDADRVLLRAAVLHRSETAFDWLLSVVERGDWASADLLVDELVVYRANHKLHQRLRDALDRRGDQRLLSSFERQWGTGAG